MKRIKFDIKMWKKIKKVRWILSEKVKEAKQGKISKNEKVEKRNKLYNETKKKEKRLKMAKKEI